MVQAVQQISEKTTTDALTLGDKPRVVICGSYHPSTLSVIVGLMEKFSSEGWRVFPNSEHIKASQPSIEVSHLKTRDESEDTLTLRGNLSWKYLEEIIDADMVYFVNEKEGCEYMGSGALLELGFALAYGKSVCFYREPENNNVISVLKTYRIL